MNFEDFVTRLTDAYEHLYDLAYLRTHPLTQVFNQDKPGTGRDHAWNTHHLLLDVIQELDPGNAPITSREWRRHRLLMLRYADGLTAQAVADQLAISRRHYYRAHDDALRALAGILWSRIENHSTLPEPASPADKSPVDRMELLRLEAAQMSRVDRRSDIHEVLEGVRALLDAPARQHQLDIRLEMDAGLPPLAVDPRLLRQLLVALAGYLIERAGDGAICCQIYAGEANAGLKIEVTDSTRLQTAPQEDSAVRLAALDELAALCSVSVTPLRRNSAVAGFIVNLPLLRPRHTILLIDDNDDILELVRRYLGFNDYDVRTAKTAQEAIQIATAVRPSAIILDLMMPDRDGWDLLQFFSHQPHTQSTPIIICSVLRQKELALSLGASAFIEKPVSEQALIHILRQVIGESGDLNGVDNTPG